MIRPDIRDYALALADAAAQRSEDSVRRVGCALVGRAGLVLALGYNGPPSGVDLAPAEWADRELTLLYTVHAEANALRSVRPGEPMLLASTYQPCAECLKAAASYGIREVVYRELAKATWSVSASIVARRFGMDLEWRPARPPTNAEVADLGLAVPGVDFPADADPGAPYEEGGPG